MNILGLNSSSGVTFDIPDSYSQKENTSYERNSQDTISISDEARVLFMQLQEANTSTDDGAGQDEDAESSTAQEFKDIINSHKPGSGSSQSSSEDAIEDVRNKINQVSSELASIASKSTQSDSGKSSSQVQQLESQLSQLESLLAELEAAATEETTS